jgi:hypothetical protein
MAPVISQLAESPQAEKYIATIITACGASSSKATLAAVLGNVKQPPYVIPELTRALKAAGLSPLISLPEKPEGMDDQDVMLAFLELLANSKTLSKAVAK